MEKSAALILSILRNGCLKVRKIKSNSIVQNATRSSEMLFGLVKNARAWSG